MKKILLAIFAFAMIFALTACSEGGDTAVSASTTSTPAPVTSNEDVVIIDGEDEANEPSIEYKKPSDIFAQVEKLQKNPVELMEVPSDMLLDYYGIDTADVSEGIYYISLDNMLADEFVILVAANEDAADRLEEKLQARLERKLDEAEGYSPEQAAIIEKCSVLRDKNYVSLIVSPDFDAIAQAYKDYIK